MDFKDTQEEAKFRKKCRDWLEKNASPKDDSTPQNDDFANKDKMKAAKEWQKKKYDAGWAMLHWPKEYALSPERSGRFRLCLVVGKIDPLPRLFFRAGCRIRNLLWR